MHAHACTCMCSQKTWLQTDRMRACVSTPIELLFIIDFRHLFIIDLFIIRWTDQKARRDPKEELHQYPNICTHTQSLPHSEGGTQTEVGTYSKNSHC